jgi:ComF family protein
MADPVYGSAAANVAPTRVELVTRLLGAVLPVGCLACGEPLVERRSTLNLCPACRKGIRSLPAPACAVCSRPLAGYAGEAQGHCCPACRASPPAFERLLALWSYEPPVDTVLLALKFRRLDYLAGHLAGEILKGLAARLPVVEGVVAVPLHWRRQLLRGYNQAELIAGPIAKELGVPLLAVLAKRRATRPQSRLQRKQRMANLRKAFAVRRPDRIAGRRLLLVDDVATTGATLQSAASALKAGGASAVFALVVARTPETG